MRQSTFMHLCMCLLFAFLVDFWFDRFAVVIVIISMNLPCSSSCYCCCCCSYRYCAAVLSPDTIRLLVLVTSSCLPYSIFLCLPQCAMPMPTLCCALCVLRARALSIYLSISVCRARSLSCAPAFVRSACMCICVTCNAHLIFMTWSVVVVIIL